MSIGRVALTALIIGVVFTAIDFVWLTLVAKQFYAQQIGHLLAAKPNLLPAALFYVMYIAGMAYFVVLPALAAGSWRLALVNGALFGLFTYGTYDLTNWATLRDWPARLVAVDMAWGVVLSAGVGAASFGLLRGVFHV